MFSHNFPLNGEIITNLLRTCYRKTGVLDYHLNTTQFMCADPLAFGNPLETISLADKTDRLARLRLEGSCSARAWLRVRVPNH